MKLCFFPEGKNTAKQYACKYIEVSATIDHQIDELFVGILKQIRLIASCSSGSSIAAISSSAYPHSQLIDADDADEDVTSTSCLCSGRGKHSPSQERRYDAASASLGWNSGEVTPPVGWNPPEIVTANAIGLCSPTPAVC